MKHIRWDETDYSDAPPEVREQMKKAMEDARRIMGTDSKRLGKVMVFGTGGEAPNDEMLNIFMNPDNYKLIPFKDDTNKESR